MEFLFRRKGASGFSSSSTAEEVTDGIDASGLTAIVTGASSGIGAETARVLALRGAHVVIGVRNVATGNEVREAIVREIDGAKVDVMELDLSSLESVRKLASEFEASASPLHYIDGDANLNICNSNNAGVMLLTPPFKLSKDNIELQFATNHLGHFFLTNLLLETMKKTSQISGKEGRIVVVSSDAHRFTYREGIRFDTINEKKQFSRLDYSQSKFANILHSNELARRLKEEGVNITVNSLHPGSITTGLFRGSGFMEGVVNVLGKYVFKNVQQGAATTCYVALHPQVKGQSGQYFENSNISKSTKQAMDIDLAKKLWDFSTNLVNSIVT